MGDNDVSIHSRRLGREKQVARCAAVLSCVSIHSRRLGREKRGQTSNHHSRIILGFNPLPPSRTGETHVLRVGWAYRVGFNPLPPSRTGETVLGAWDYWRMAGFQSTPAV